MGRTVHCTRFSGKGDLNPTGHVSSMERTRGCRQPLCTRRFDCRADPRTRAAAGALDSCTEAFACKSLPVFRSPGWDPAHFFDGVRSVHCHSTPRISRIKPALGDAQGGSIVRVYGTGFSSPARCRFGWLETPAENVTARLLLCRVPALLKTPTDREWHTMSLQRLMRHPVMIEVSTMSRVTLYSTPMTEALREATFIV